SLTELVEEILSKTGLRASLEEENSIEADVRIENLEEFKSITKNYEEEIGVISLPDFLNEVAIVSDISEHQESTNRVSLMTIHAVKGLEFDNVFIVGMEEGIFPHYNSINEGTTSAIEEERRLCYVAITRAKKNLWMLNTKRRMLFGNTQINMPSRFMDEIDPKYLEVENNRTGIIDKMVNFVKEEKFRTEDVNYNTGDHVMHDEYGEGVVISTDGSIVTIAFPHPYGIKKMMAKHKSITKI
ncbi:MAG: ATP-binding domain-containing protein, partial [Bacilli bacterium]|nr:ATP-binding domain-containing protein [Bacilli bacterium]